MKLIKFWRIPPRITYLWHGKEFPVGEIAFNEEDLAKKLDGDIAEVHMPAKPWYVRAWRFFFPLKGIEMEVHQ
jgi:hypothetical protein